MVVEDTESPPRDRATVDLSGLSGGLFVSGYWDRDAKMLVLESAASVSESALKLALEFVYSGQLSCSRGPTVNLNVGRENVCHLGD